MSSSVVSEHSLSMKIRSPREKLEAIRRVNVGGETKASVARDLGIPESTLRGWCKNEHKISVLAGENAHTHLSTEDNWPAKKAKHEKPILTEQFNSRIINPAARPCSRSPSNKSNEGSLVFYQPQNQNEGDQERQANRAKMTKLAAELGLNDPARFLATLYHYQIQKLMNNLISNPNHFNQMPSNSINVNENPIIYMSPRKDFPSDCSEYKMESIPVNLSRPTIAKTGVVDSLGLSEHNFTGGALKKEKQNKSVTDEEALEHGEHFLRWLHSCSNPNVTKLQVNTLQNILINLKRRIDQ